MGLSRQLKKKVDAIVSDLLKSRGIRVFNDIDTLTEGIGDALEMDRDEEDDLYRYLGELEEELEEEDDRGRRRSGTRGHSRSRGSRSSRRKGRSSKEELSGTGLIAGGSLRMKRSKKDVGNEDSDDRSLKDNKKISCKEGYKYSREDKEIKLSSSIKIFDDISPFNLFETTHVLTDMMMVKHSAGKMTEGNRLMLELVTASSGCDLGIPMNDPITLFVSFINKALVKGYVGDFTSLVAMVDSSIAHADEPPEKIVILNNLIIAFKKLISDMLEDGREAVVRFATVLNIELTPLAKEFSDNISYFEQGNGIPDDSKLHSALLAIGRCTHIVFKDTAYLLEYKANGDNMIKAVLRKDLW